MTVRVELPGPVLEPLQLLLPNGLSASLDERGQVDLPHALPEGAPLALEVFRDGRWRPLGGTVRMRVEMGADGRWTGVVPTQ